MTSTWATHSDALRVLSSVFIIAQGDEGFIHNLCPSFDIPFAQLGLILRTRNKFVEIVAVAECYLIINHVKNKESSSSQSEYAFL